MAGVDFAKAVTFPDAIAEGYQDVVVAPALQVALGLANVLLHLPLAVAVGHSAGAALLLITLLHALKPPAAG